MDYIKQLNEFWDLRFELSNNETILYLTLLQINNRLHWKKSFEVTNERLCYMAKMKTDAIVNNRNKLKQKGLIDFVQGGFHKPTIYRIIDLTEQKSYPKSDHLSDHFTDHLSDHLSDHFTDHLSDHFTDHFADTYKNNTKREEKETKQDIIAREVKHKHGQYKNVLLTDKELSKLQEDFPDWEERIERLSEYVASKGAKYKSHYATIRMWAAKDKREGKAVEKKPYDWRALQAAEEARCERERNRPKTANLTEYLQRRSGGSDTIFSVINE